MGRAVREDRESTGAESAPFSPMWFGLGVVACLVLWSASTLVLPRHLLFFREVIILTALAVTVVMSVLGRRSE